MPFSACKSLGLQDISHLLAMTSGVYWLRSSVWVKPSMGLLPDSSNSRLRMHRECRERFPRHRLQRKLLVNDPGMHHGTCVTHVPWCMSGSLTSGGGENVPGIPGVCATRNFTYLGRGPWSYVHDVSKAMHKINQWYASRACWEGLKHLFIGVDNSHVTRLQESTRLFQISVGDFGLSPSQERVQMAMWSMFASQMFLSVDLRRIRDQESRDLLQNPRVLAISQDKLGIAGRRVMMVGTPSHDRMMTSSNGNIFRVTTGYCPLWGETTGHR